MGQETNNAISGKVIAKSSIEFGYITKIIIYRGFLDSATENVYLTNEFDKDNFELNYKFEIKRYKSKNYFRIEIRTIGPKGEHFAFSNPIWITENNLAR